MMPPNACPCGGRLVTRSEIEERLCVPCMREKFERLEKAVATAQAMVDSLQFEKTSLATSLALHRDQNERRAELDQVERDGTEAFRRGAPLTENPHPEGDLHGMWDYGWARAKEAEDHLRLEALLRHTVSVVSSCIELAEGSGIAAFHEIIDRLRAIQLRSEDIVEGQ